jgi:hypothetical protein
MLAKILGYLYLIQRRYGVIAETDDDNSPYDTWATPTAGAAAASHVLVEVSDRSAATLHFFNVYRLYTQTHIWPRDFPLEGIHPRQPTPSRSGPLKPQQRQRLCSSGRG